MAVAEGASQSALTVYATVPYMLMEGGAAASRTGDHQRAVGLLEHSLAQWPAEEQLPDRTLCTARLALAYAHVGEIAAAASTASVAHRGLATAPSTRASVLLDEVTGMVSRDGSLYEVQELEELRRTKPS